MPGIEPGMAECDCVFIDTIAAMQCIIIPPVTLNDKCVKIYCDHSLGLPPTASQDVLI